MDKYKLGCFEELLKLIKQDHEIMMKKHKQEDVIWALLINQSITISLFENLVEALKSE